MKNLKESLRIASRDYAGIKEDVDSKEETYFYPHAAAQIQAYEAGFKAALIALSGFIEYTIKEISE